MDKVHLDMYLSWSFETWISSAALSNHLNGQLVLIEGMVDD